MLGLKSKVYFTTIADALANKDNFTGTHRAIGSATLDSRENGSMRQMGEGEYYIAFGTPRSKAKMLETIAHELGHLHQREAFDTADAATQKAIRDAHSKWVATTKTCQPGSWSIACAQNSRAASACRGCAE